MTKQIVYKLRHKETGLFFEPKGYGCNVSLLGKIYSNKKPPRQSFLKLPYSLMGSYGYDRATELEDWEVVEFELNEVVNLVRSPKGKVPKDADLMTMKEFSENVTYRILTYDDGCADYSDGEYIYDDVDIYNLDRSYTHVVWYGK